MTDLHNMRVSCLNIVNAVYKAGETLKITNYAVGLGKFMYIDIFRELQMLLIENVVHSIWSRIIFRLLVKRDKLTSCNFLLAPDGMKSNLNVIFKRNANVTELHRFTLTLYRMCVQMKTSQDIYIEDSDETVRQYVIK